MTRAPVPRIQYIASAEDLDRIEFTDGLAAVEVPVELLHKLPLVGHERFEGPRLDRLVNSIRDRGYVPTTPIICRIGMKGRWVVADGGHRLTAARIVSSEFWTNFWGKKIATLYFLLFTTPGSWKKVREIAGDIGRGG